MTTLKADANEFISYALMFKERLTSAKTFEEILPLWRGTSFPYQIQVGDPFSDEYREEVLTIYERLTKDSYTELNELTSSKQSAESFEVGYPWVTRNLDVIACEMAKCVQAMRALHNLGVMNGKIVEFGAGWGNLALPLAKAGQNVTAIDIDQGFLRRIEALAAKESVYISTINADFNQAAREMANDVDAAIFQASFHHCLNFVQLLESIRDRVLSPSGVILFLSEPIFRDYTFPWGLRFDGESLWAIMQNKWLELGFEHSFFSSCLLRCGFFLIESQPVSGYVGSSWAGVPVARTLAFEDWSLPAPYEATFWDAPERGFGRFCRSESRLPSLQHAHKRLYRLTFRNFSDTQLTVRVRALSYDSRVIDAGGSATLEVLADGHEVIITSDTYVPNNSINNGDSRVLGVSLLEVACADSVVADQSATPESGVTAT